MLENIVYGLTVGSLLYITSVGLSLTFGTMRIVNYAHGVFYTLGAYLLVTLLPYLRGMSWVSAILSVVAVVPFAYVVDKFIISRLYKASIDYAIIATYALVYVVTDAVKWIWGATPIPLSDPIGKFVTAFGTSIPVYRVVIVAISVLVFFALDLFFAKTIVGKVVTAGLENREAVRALGIDVDKYFTVVFVLGSCLAALGGVLYAPITSVQPYMGNLILRLSFAVVIIGGLGNLKGTFFSAIFLGLLMAVVGMFWGAASEVAVFAAMIVALAIRPNV